MAIFVTLDDFKTGKFIIPDAGSIASAKVQECIDKFEKSYIYKLLGVALGDLLITYKQAVSPPANIHYDKIISAFASDVALGCGKIIQSLGIKEYLKASIYFEYVKNGLVNSQAGVINSKAETATKTSPAETLRFAENKFNDLLETVEAIRWYCFQNSTAFPDFNGEHIKGKFSNYFV